MQSRKSFQMFFTFSLLLPSSAMALSPAERCHQASVEVTPACYQQKVPPNILSNDCRSSANTPFREIVACAQKKADLIANTCLAKTQKSLKVCHEIYSRSLDEVARLEREIGKGPFTPEQMDDDATFDKISKLGSERQLVKQAELEITGMSSRYEQVLNEYENLETKLGKILPRDNREPEKDPSANSKTPSKEKSSNAGETLNALGEIGGSLAEALSVPFEQKMAQVVGDTSGLKTQLQSEGGSSSVAVGNKQVKSKTDGQVDASAGLDSLGNENSSAQEFSKTGVLPQQASQQGRFSSTAGSGLSAKEKNLPREALRANFDSRNSGTYGPSGSSAGAGSVVGARGTTRVPRNFSNNLHGGSSALQIQKKILDLKSRSLASKAQLRFDAGITGPHSNIFTKVRFRYERLSSSLKP